MLMTNRGSRSFRTAALLGASAVLFFLAVPPVLAATDCPTQNPNGSIQCSGGNYWCGGTCQAQPTCPTVGPGDPNGVKIERNCTACACACPTALPNDCISSNGQCQATNATCAAQGRASICSTVAGVMMQVCGACLGGYVLAPDGSCTDKYIFSNPSSGTQPISSLVSGDFSIAGNVGTGLGNLKLVAPNVGANSGNIFMQSGKAIHVDNTAAAATSLNIGNWYGGSATYDADLNLYGSFSARDLTIGTTTQLTVSTAGDLTKIKDVSYSWPVVNAVGALRNNGSGILSWSDMAPVSGNDGFWNRAGTVLQPAYVNDRIYINSAANAPAIYGQVSSNFATIQAINTNASGASAYGVYGQGYGAGLYGSGSNYGVYGWANYGVYGQGGNYGVYGQGSNYGVYGAGNYGVYGYGYGAGVAGVYGAGAAGIPGVRGYSNSGAAAVYGDATSGQYGVYGTGVYGVYGTGTNYGIYGSGTGVAGVYGVGSGVPGVKGYSNSAAAAVYGDATSGQYGVYGVGNYGVYGTSGYIGVAGSGTTNGVYATSPGTGVYSFGTATGVAAYSSGNGVYGNGSTGVYGDGSSYGVYGTGNYGVYGIGNALAGVYGRGSASGVPGVLGESTVSTAPAVYGYNNSGISGSVGVYGNTGSLTIGTGVYGRGANGVFGFSGSSAGAGVYGQTSAANGPAVYGYSTAANSTGVFGNAVLYGVYGQGQYGVYGSGSAYGGYFYTSGTNVGVYAFSNGGRAAHFQSTGEQLRLGYDASNYTTLVTNGSGDLTITPTGGDVVVPGTVTMNVAKIVTGAAAGNVLTAKDATGLAEWKSAVFANECTGGKYDHLTASTYNGNQGGYLTADNICGANMHICTPDEVLRSVYCTGHMALPASGNAWVNNGPPGFTSPAANDCNGWTSNSGSNYGTFWQFGGTSGGKGFATSCSIALKFACCTTTAP